MMKTVNTVPGMAYAVYAGSSCVVTDSASGLQLCAVEPGSPSFFVALADSVTVSEDSARVVRSFNRAPGMLPGAGGGNISPYDLIDGDFLLLGDNYSSVEGRLDTVTDGSYLFYRTPITGFDIPLPALKSGSNMFYGCTKLASFSGDLPALTSGYRMFQYCHSLALFNCGDLSALTDSSYMLESTGLTSFSCALPALTNGTSMFYDCPGMTSWTGALPALTSGFGMFNKCKLDLASVGRIADTINDLASKGKTGSITIGMSSELQGNEDLAAALAAIRAKGWTVTEQYNS